MTPLTAIMEASDCMVKCEPVFEQPRLLDVIKQSPWQKCIK